MKDQETEPVALRAVTDADLPVFFDHQQDAEARTMAAFTSEDPTDRAAFEKHWARIRGDATTKTRTILCAGEVAGHVASFVREGHREVTYWIGKSHWGRGIASRALETFVEGEDIRPLYARVAADNVRSLRVLEKCGFAICGEARGFAHARGEEIAELILRLP